jgi:hypothetical protein
VPARLVLGSLHASHTARSDCYGKSLSTGFIRGKVTTSSTSLKTCQLIHPSSGDELTQKLTQNIIDELESGQFDNPDEKTAAGQIILCLTCHLVNLYNTTGWRQLVCTLRGFKINMNENPLSEERLGFTILVIGVLAWLLYCALMDVEFIDGEEWGITLPLP